MNARYPYVLVSRLVVLILAVAALVAAPAPARTKLAPLAPPPTVRPTPDRYSITADAPRWQARTPAQVVGYIYGTDKVFDGVIVFNGGTSTLTEIQIGCILEGVPAGVANPVDLGYVPFGTGPVEIPPNTLGLVTLAPLTVVDVSARIRDIEVRDVVATLGVVNAKWANGRKFAAPDVSNGFRVKPNPALEAKFTLVATAHPIGSIADLTSIWNFPVIVWVPDDDDIYFCKTITGWQCLVRSDGECGGSIMCTSCTSSTARKCVKLPEIDPPNL